MSQNAHIDPPFDAPPITQCTTPQVVRSSCLVTFHTIVTAQRAPLNDLTSSTPPQVETQAPRQHAPPSPYWTSSALPNSIDVTISHPLYSEPWHHTPRPEETTGERSGFSSYSTSNCQPHQALDLHPANPHPKAPNYRLILNTPSLGRIGHNTSLTFEPPLLSQPPRPTESPQSPHQMYCTPPKNYNLTWEFELGRLKMATSPHSTNHLHHQHHLQPTLYSAISPTQIPIGSTSRVSSWLQPLGPMWPWWKNKHPFTTHHKCSSDNTPRDDPPQPHKRSSTVLRPIPNWYITYSHPVHIIHTINRPRTWSSLKLLLSNTTYPHYHINRDHARSITHMTTWRYDCGVSPFYSPNTAELTIHSISNNQQTHYIQHDSQNTVYINTYRTVRANTYESDDVITHAALSGTARGDFMELHESTLDSPKKTYFSLGFFAPSYESALEHVDHRRNA